MKVVTMITPKYLNGFYHFYKSYKLFNNIPITCYLINFSAGKIKVLKDYFSDVNFIEYKGQVSKTNDKTQPEGVLNVTFLKGYFMFEQVRKNKKAVWLDASKLVMGDISFTKELLDKYEWFGVRRNTNKPNKMYWAGMFGFNYGDEIQRYQRRCNEGKDWFCDQRAFTYLKGNFKDLDYNKYVSGEMNIYNENMLLVRNLAKQGKDKFNASEEYFIKIMEKKIENYREDYKKFLASFPKKILAFMHHPYEDWCFLSSINNVKNNTNLDIEICDNFKPEYLKDLDPDIVWSRGGLFLMDDFFKKRPDLKCKTISTLTHGGELLTDRIPKILRYIDGTKGILVQNHDGKIRMEHEIKKRKSNIPVHLIPNMVDLDHFKPKDKPKEFTVGYVGRDNKGSAKDQKGYTVFNYVKEILEKEGVKFKISTNTQNKLPHKKMPEFYNSVNCMILPSHSEGHSNALNEAMACGLPVISTKVGWHGENCKDNENILFCVRSVYDILNKVRYIKNNPQEAYRIGSNARKTMEQELNPQKIGKQWEDLFNGL